MQHNIQEKQEETQCAAMGIQCFFLFMGMMRNTPSDCHDSSDVTDFSIAWHVMSTVHGVTET